MSFVLLALIFCGTVYSHSENVCPTTCTFNTSIMYLIPGNPCYTNPSTQSCSTFEIDHEEYHLTSECICCSMPWMFACGLYDYCEDNLATRPAYLEPYCGHFSIPRSGCYEMPTMTACEPITELCAAGSVAPQCNTTSHPFLIVSSSSVLAA